MRLGLVSAAVLSGFLALAQPASAFEGSIRYRVTEKKHNTTNEVTLTMAGAKLRVEANMKGHTVAFIANSGTKELITLIPERQTYSVASYNPSATGPKHADETLRKTGASDVVAGYPVEEWVTQEGGETKAHLWITTKLGRGFSMPQSGAASRFAVPAELKDKGMPLRITTPKGFDMEALKVEPGSPDPSLFKVPDGYTKTDSGIGFAGSGGSLPPDAQARLQSAMQNMTPQQKAAMEQMMQGQGAPAGQ